MGKVQCTGIGDEYLGQVWPKVVPLLTPALGEGERIEDVLSRLFLKTAQLWIGADETEIHVACVTEIVSKGGTKYCNVWLTGGKGVNNWVWYLDTIEDWAKEQGCDAMLIEKARAGWKRILPAYKTKTIQLVKEIDHGRQ
jgi:hypothetical protein